MAAPGGGRGTPGGRLQACLRGAELTTWLTRWGGRHAHDTQLFAPISALTLAKLSPFWVPILGSRFGGAAALSRQKREIRPIRESVCECRHMFVPGTTKFVPRMHLWMRVRHYFFEFA